MSTSASNFRGFARSTALDLQLCGLATLPGRWRRSAPGTTFRDHEPGPAEVASKDRRKGLNMTFKPNPNFEKELEAELTPHLEQAINGVAESHAGRSPAEIKAALIAAAAPVTFEPSDELVEQIANSKD